MKIQIPILLIVFISFTTLAHSSELGWSSAKDQFILKQAVLNMIQSPESSFLSRGFRNDGLGEVNLLPVSFAWEQNVDLSLRKATDDPNVVSHVRCCFDFSRMSVPTATQKSIYFAHLQSCREVNEDGKSISPNFSKYGFDAFGLIVK